jgi:hypothetical protein
MPDMKCIASLEKQSLFKICMPGSLKKQRGSKTNLVEFANPFAYLTKNILKFLTQKN